MTSERRALTPGVVIADRYELHDLVSERLGCSNWRAHDQILNRNVRLELLPASDPRAANFLQAARESTRVTDHHFLRVLDLIEDDDGYHGIVREWARAVPLSQVLQEAPLPNRRAVTIIAEVADAIAHAHAHGVYHRRLTPHQILLKESGAVRIVGLGVATALAPADHQVSEADKAGYERADVEAIGKLLYACLVSRWPGGHTDGLRAAPTEHGRLLRPRRVRAGVARDIDTVCDRILGQPPRHHQTPLTTAADIAHVLNLVGEDDEPPLAFAGEARQSSPDLLRLDPVVEPSGPPPGLTPPRRRPKAFEPAPPTRVERGRARLRAAARGDRGLVLLGVLGTVTIVAVLALLVQQATHEGGPPLESTPTETAPTTVLPIDRALDFDPQGADRAENPQLVENALDDDAGSGWYTSTYYGDPALGRLKDGVGLVLDLGRPSQVEQVQLRLAGSPTDISILTTPSTQQDPPTNLSELREVAVLDGAGEDAAIALPSGTYSRYVVVWLRSLPQVGSDEYRGEIRAVAVRGR